MALFGGNDQELNVTVRAKDEASATLNKLNTNVATLAKGFVLGDVASRALRSGFNLLKGTVVESMAAFEESEKVTAQMNATLESTGHAAGLSGQELTKMADALAKTTLYSDEAVMSAQNLLLTFTNIGKDVFPTAIDTVLNMSTALGQDLKSSSIQLGKALNDPIEGINALRRVGVNFTASQQEMIEKLVKTGQTVKAQTLILEELNTEFGGSAKSAYEASSSITKLNKQVEEIKEDIGRGLTPALNNLFSAFSTLTSGMGANADIGKTVFNVTSRVFEGVVATAVGVYELASAFVYLGSYIAQGVAALNGWDADEKEFFSNFRASVGEGMASAKEFALNLMEQNEAVRTSWGQTNDSVGEFASKGPAAYQATAKEAEEAARKIEDANKAVADTERKIKDLQETLLGDLLNEKQNLARQFVEQEQKIADMREQIANESDQKRRIEMQNQLDAEIKALEERRFFESSLSSEVAEERRRAGLTDFEREVEDIQRRIVEKTNEFNKRMELLKAELRENEGKRAKLAAIEAEVTKNVTVEVKAREGAVVASINTQVNKYNELAAAAARAQAASFSAVGVGVGSLSSGVKTTTPMVIKRQHGGIVPGPEGMAVPIIAHGQEEIIPASGRNDSGIGGGITVTINNPVVRSDNDLREMVKQIEDYFRPLLVNTKISG